jgi:hypothetical protein
MRSIWGTVTEIRDLGVVAEQCPHCERLEPCILRSVCRGESFLFVKVAKPFRENSCLCTACLKAFPCESSWRYAAVLPIQEAKSLPVEVLLRKTNPVLAERIQFKQQVRALGGDIRFAAAYEHLEAMRPGALRSEMLRQLLDWDRLEEEKRALLEQQVGARARAWQLARHLAGGFPRTIGCLLLPVAALVVGLAFLSLPAIRGWLWGGVTVVAGLIAATFFSNLLLTRWVCRWTRRVLIPEAQDANVSLDCFIAVVDDVPEWWLGLKEDLWPMKDQLDTIRGVLIAAGKLEKH